MELKPGSMGKPTPGNHVEIINEEGEVCPVGEVGDIAVHIETPALFKNYYKDPERTAMQFRGDYYITGDKAKKMKKAISGLKDAEMILSSVLAIQLDHLKSRMHLLNIHLLRNVRLWQVQMKFVVIVKAFVVLKDEVDANDPELTKRLARSCENINCTI